MVRVDVALVGQDHAAEALDLACGEIHGVGQLEVDPGVGDVVEVHAEGVAVAQAQIETAEDNLRTLVLNPSSPDFWTTQIVPTELPAFQPSTVDLDGAVRNALQMRTDLLQARKALESADINIKYFRNQALPDVTATFDYGVTGLGGTPVARTNSFGIPVVVPTGTPRNFASVLGDLFGNHYPNWTLGLNISYPLGMSSAKASVARARVQLNQDQAQLKQAELQVATDVTNAALQVQSGLTRYQAATVARSLAQQRLDAEQSRFDVGLSTNYFVVQAQRDLATAQNTELRALLDYRKALVDYERLQETPATRGAGITTINAAAGGAAAAGN